MTRSRFVRLLGLAGLFLAGCSDGRNASLAVRLTYPQDATGSAAAPASEPSGGAARPLSGGAAAPAYVKLPGNRILIRVLAPHLPSPMEAWFDRAAGRGEIAGIPPGDRIVVEVDEYDSTAATLLGRGWAQGVTLAAGEYRTVAVPVYGKGTIVRVCGADNTAGGGSGTPGDSGDGGLADNAALGLPLAVATGPGDQIFVSSSQFNRVRKIDRYGYIGHYAGNGSPGTLTNGQAAATAPIGAVYNMDVGPTGDLYLITPDQQILRVDAATGQIAIKYNGRKGDFNPALKPDLAVVGDAMIFYTNAMEDNVYLVHDGVRDAYIMDNSSLTPATEPEPALLTTAVLRKPSGLTLDSATGSVVYASKDSNRIKRLDLALNRIYTIVGSATPLIYADNIARTDMEPQYPYLVEYDRFGKKRYFFAEEGSNTIKFVRLDVEPNRVWTLAGNGTLGYSGDGGPATAARLRNPRSLATDSRGNVYIADTENHAVRMVVGGALP